jgi:hypothetical protein
LPQRRRDRDQAGAVGGTGGVPELGQLPGHAQGVGGACWTDLSHVCKTFNIGF